MQNKYKNKGVILLAVSYEPEKTVKTYVDKQKLPYVVGAGAEDTMKAYDVKGFPTAFLIDPEGKVAWTGHPATVEEALDKLLKEKPPTGKSFLVTGSAKSLFKKAESLYKKKKYEEALETYQELSGKYSSTKEGKDAKAKIKKIKGNSSIMSKIKAAKSEREASKWLRAARALAQDGDPADAVKYYQRILKKFPDTKSAKFANEEIGAMKEAAKKTGGDKDSDEDEDEEEDASEDEEADDSESEDEAEEDSDESDADE